MTSIDCRKCKNIDRYFIADFIEIFPSVNEDSLTEVLLWQLKRNYCINIYRFSRREESQTGADFSIASLGFYIIYGNNYIGLLFQAKKLIQEEGEYCRNIYRKKSGNSQRLQINLLIEHANRQNYLPFYIFYTNYLSTTCRNSECFRYRFESRLFFSPPYYTSLFIREANDLKRFLSCKCNTNNNRISKTEILRDAKPFCCLFCCPIANTINPNPLDHILDFIWFSFYSRNLEFEEFKASREERNEFLKYFLNKEYKEYNQPLGLKKFKEKFLKRGIPETIKYILEGKWEKITEDILKKDGILITIDRKQTALLFDKIAILKIF